MAGKKSKYKLYRETYTIVLFVLNLSMNGVREDLLCQFVAMQIAKYGVGHTGHADRKVAPIYMILKYMRREGILSSYLQDVDDGHKSRFYMITQKGKEFVARHTEFNKFYDQVGDAEMDKTMESIYDDYYISQIQEPVVRKKDYTNEDGPIAKDHTK